DGLELLYFTKKSVKTISLSFDKLLRLYQKYDEVIEDYDDVRKVNSSRNQLLYSRDYINKITTTLDTVQTLRHELESSDVNLLQVHTKLGQLERIRDELLYTAKDDPEQRRYLSSYFHPVNDLCSKLESIMWTFLSNLIELCSTAPRFIVSIMLIVQRECAIDKEVTIPDLKIDTSSRPKNYKTKATSVILNSISTKFETFLLSDNNNSSTLQSLKETIEKLRFVFKDLEIVQTHAVKCMPPDFAIFDMYLDNYNERVRTLLRRFTEPPLINSLDTSDIWLLMNYVDQYVYDMLHRLNVPLARIEPLILQGKDELLNNLYTAQVKLKMKTWTKNLLNSEHEEWFSGKRKHEEPEKNEKGQYISSLPVVLFQMIEQQLSVASKTKRSTFKGLVLQECIEALFYFQENFEQMIRQQGERFLNDEPNNEFFNEYMMIVVNNCCKCTQYAQHLAINLLEELDFSTRDRTKTRVANVVRGFQKLAQSAYSFLIKVILKDSQDCFSSFFTKNWYSKTSQDLETILLTTDDYFQDFQAHMVEDMFIQLAN
ncbi:exocyst complex component 3-like, partial [Zophobas morio]|uniref:exocyst complex component 3-like n=1 Tax=Zophobas morio TaxID=2755281 RepID=UPI003082990F